MRFHAYQPQLLGLSALLRALVFGTCVLISSSSISLADSVSESASFPPTDTAFDLPWSIKGFDSNLGSLQSVDIDLTIAVDQTAVYKTVPPFCTLNVVMKA